MGVKIFEKNFNNKAKGKKCAKLEFVLGYTSNLQKFLANNFLWVHFIQLFPRM